MSLLRTDRDKFLDGIGVAPGHLREGVRVIVPVGAGTGTSSSCALAVCREPAEREGYWWFEVYMGATSPIPQMFPVDQLLGLAADGLTMPGMDVDAAVQPI